MKKGIIIYAIAALFAVLNTSCQKDSLVEQRRQENVKSHSVHRDPNTTYVSGFDCSFSTIPVQVASPNKKKYQITTICSSNKNTKQ